MTNCGIGGFLKGQEGNSMSLRWRVYFLFGRGRRSPVVPLFLSLSLVLSFLSLLSLPLSVSIKDNNAPAERRG